MLNIRHSLELTQAYRRFQMDFTTAETASQFIKLVSAVCPCSTTDRVPRTNRGRPQATLTSAPSSRSHPVLTKAKKPAPTRQRKTTSTQLCQTGPSSTIFAGSDDSHTLPSGSSDPLSEAPFPAFSQPALPATCGQAAGPSLSEYDISSRPATSGLLPPSQTFLPSTPIPSSSQTLPDPTISPQLPFQPGARPPNSECDAFLESLMRSPTLYDLSRSQLEVVVSQVIREDGFIKLVSVDIHRHPVLW